MIGGCGGGGGGAPPGAAAAAAPAPDMVAIGRASWA